MINLTSHHKFLLAEPEETDMYFDLSGIQSRLFSKPEHSLSETIEMPDPDNDTGHQIPILSCTPNPFQQSLSIEYSGFPARGGSIEIFNTEGYLVRGFQISDYAHGTVEWDGMDESGEPQPAGMYFIRIKTGKGFCSSKLLVKG